MDTQAPLRILSLDGGGVRGISSLYILKELMAQINRQHRVEIRNEPTSIIQPCDIFDLICGTSTGGLIAIMLGRLKMVRLSSLDSIAMVHCLLNYRQSIRLLPSIPNSLKPFSSHCRNRRLPSSTTPRSRSYLERSLQNHR